MRNGSKVAPRESQNVEVSGTITGVKEITTVVQFQEAIAIPGKLLIYHLIMCKPMNPVSGG